MKKTVLISTTLAVMIAIWLVTFSNKSDQKIKKVAIVTTLSHPALENARLGFIQTIRAKHAELDLKLEDYNAEGSLQQANLIAQKIASDQNIVGIFAIGTLAAQTLAKVERVRPIVVAAVFDPKTIVSETANNVCGLTDAISAEFQIDTLFKLLPNIKSIALLYSPSEANSASMVKNLSEAIDKRALLSTVLGVHESQQIIPASHQACKKGDVVLIPLDNQLVAAMPAVIKATRSLPCIIITSNESPIHQGATIAFGVDYTKNGEQAGLILRQILDGQLDPITAGFSDPKSVGIYVNDHVLAEKKLSVNEHAVADLVHVKGGN